MSEGTSALTVRGSSAIARRFASGRHRRRWISYVAWWLADPRLPQWQTCGAQALPLVCRPRSHTGLVAPHPGAEDISPDFSGVAMNDKKRNSDPSNAEDAFERAAGSGAWGGDDIDQMSPTEQSPESEQGDGSSAPDTGSDVAELSTRDDWRRRVDEQRDKHLRLAAEYDNFRKRAAKERQEAGWRAQAEMVRGLIEALDDLTRFAHVDPATVDSATVVQGADMVEKKMMKSLAGHGLEVID